MKITVERLSSHAETAAEMDRRGKVIEQLEAEIARLKPLTARVKVLKEALGEAVTILDNGQNSNPPHMQKYLAKWEAALRGE